MFDFLKAWVAEGFGRLHSHQSLKKPEIDRSVLMPIEGRDGSLAWLSAREVTKQGQSFRALQEMGQTDPKHNPKESPQKDVPFPNEDLNPWFSNSGPIPGLGYTKSLQSIHSNYDPYFFEPIIVAANSGSGPVAPPASQVSEAQLEDQFWFFGKEIPVWTWFFAPLAGIVISNQFSSSSGSSSSAPADTTAPTATITMSDTALKSGDTSTVTVVFSEAVSNFSVADLTAPSGSIGTMSSADNITWTGTFTPTANVEDSTNVINLATTYTDASGNTGTAAATANYAVDTASPALTRMDASGALVTLTFSEALDGDNLPATGDFSVKVNGVAAVVSSLALNGSNSAKLELTLATGLVAGDSLQVSYSDPSGLDDANAIQDAFGNDATGFAQGKLADGYIKGAQIWLDTNGDGTADLDLGITTDAQGNFFLPSQYLSSGGIVAIGGVNIDTGLPNTISLKAPAGATVVNPLTTLVQKLVEGGTEASVANSQVAAVFGVNTEAGQSLSDYDPIANSDTAAQKVAAQIATITSLAGSANADSVVDNLVTQVQSSDTQALSIDLSNAATLASVVQVDDASLLSSIADASESIAAAGSLSAITLQQSLSLDSLAPSKPTLTASSVINPYSGGAIRLAIDVTSTDGTGVVAGDTVLLSVDGSPVALAVSEVSSTDVDNGYVALNLSDTVAEGSHTLVAQIVDKAGNLSTASDSLIVSFDSKAPAKPFFNTISDDDIISGSETTSSITGLGEVGATITLGLGD